MGDDELLVGIDAGSTTVKVVALSPEGEALYRSYRRHRADIAGSLAAELREVAERFPSMQAGVTVTGSAGLGVAERQGVPFVQEVVASIKSARRRFPAMRTLIDLGGEDAKMVFFEDGRQPDIRMNGSCAGGTGAFIDQMAALMHITVTELGEKALCCERIYPIASRCGVFAKTDVQNLLARNVSVADVSGSALHAVALQCISTLARGYRAKGPALCIGGPLTFLPALRRAFAELLGLDEGVDGLFAPEDGVFVPAEGAALSLPAGAQKVGLRELAERLAENAAAPVSASGGLEPLFADAEDYAQWCAGRKVRVLPFRMPVAGESMGCFLGVDSGSTTTKVVVIDETGTLRYTYYADNEGIPLQHAAEGIAGFQRLAADQGASFRFLSSAATGYGEDLIKSALGLDYGVVETMAHLAGAQFIDPEVSFVLDVGGQDMKSIFARSGVISRVELNEACSSGCGSFLQNFASMLGLSTADFVHLACMARNPNDLGTRCTVFMNSKVKQSLRENAAVGDIAAGLAYSVVKNCLFKVLKIGNLRDLGDHVVLQGGAFRNDAVYRAFERLSGKTVSSTDRPELMGALGAALFAKNGYRAPGCASAFDGREALPDFSSVAGEEINCKGCTNGCTVQRFRFPNGNVCFAGNRCERVFHNGTAAVQKGYNAFAWKNRVLFDRASPAGVSDSAKGGKRRVRIGVPRVLNMYEEFPFWHKLLTECGFDVILSPESTPRLYRLGVSHIASDTVCFPAKLVHGHILALETMGVDRICYPLVMKEMPGPAGSVESYNCPVVAGYPEVVRSSMDPETEAGIVLDKPVISFDSQAALRRTSFAYLRSLGVKKRVFVTAFAAAVKEMSAVRRLLSVEQLEHFERVVGSGRPAFVVAGRPYHADPLVQQQVGQIVSDLGVNVFTDDVFCGMEGDGFAKLDLVSQWAFPNRPVQAAMQVVRYPENVQMVQLNSFGCGPDSFFLNETAEILKAAGKNHTVLRIDEIAAPGSIRLRLRSLVESLKFASPPVQGFYEGYERVYEAEDADKTILVPWFSDFASPFLPAVAAVAGLKVVNLPPSTAASAECGLKFAHNEVCYPLTLVTGDIVRALQSGEYDTHEVVVAMTQTGGQCRATNYIAQIKGALKTAGFAHVPVLSLSGAAAGGIHNGQAFSLPLRKIGLLLLEVLLYADGLQQLFNATVVREKSQGVCRELFLHYVNKGVEAITDGRTGDMTGLLREAVEAFNGLPLSDGKFTPVGLVGEIYVKYNNFAQAHIASWLRSQGLEAVTPPLMDFFLQYFVNEEENVRNGLAKSGLKNRFLSPALYRFVSWRMRRIERVMEGFRFYRRQVSIFVKAEYAAEILSLANQFGEGWMIAAEVACYARAGVDRVVCLQPFGCIANHIVAKGIEKRLKQVYPTVSILYLDLDGGTS
ncbi:MAG: acyl-CoA dehydratase activase-related protein, partial [Tannerellaceae bacterium]|nr:acyl-CoA dehydratase activase-related protein [Tannerellaceae bacterium]